MMLQSFEMLSDRVGNQLVEGLRRKNEALKKAAKRERADPLYVLAPLVSPICLNDDASALQLLVKLERHQDAATAYAARRSLLLMERSVCVYNFLLFCAYHLSSTDEVYLKQKLTLYLIDSGYVQFT